MFHLMNKPVVTGTRPDYSPSDFSKGDVVKYVSRSGELIDGQIEAILPMVVRGLHDHQFMFVHPRTKLRTQRMFSDIRIERIISRSDNNDNDDKLQDTKRFYYLL